MCVCTKGWTLHHPRLWSTKYFEDAPFIPNRDNICSFYCYLKGVSKHVKALTISKQLKTTVVLNINKTSCKKGMSKNWGWLSTLLKDWTLEHRPQYCSNQQQLLVGVKFQGACFWHCRVVCVSPANDQTVDSILVFNLVLSWGAQGVDGRASFIPANSQESVTCSHLQALTLNLFAYGDTWLSDGPSNSKLTLCT